MVGYSGTPLTQKLGIKPGDAIAFINPPKNYAKTLGTLPEGVKVSSRLGSNLNVVQMFVTSRADLERYLPAARKSIRQDGMIWISWPKQAAKMITDLNENVVRGIGLEAGLVDIKVCAVDETWSGLKFVIRVKDRKR